VRQSGWCAVGWGPTQATIRKGVRWSTYRAYLRRVMHEDHVHVLTHTTALKARLRHSFLLKSHFFTPSERKELRVSLLNVTK